MLQRGALRMEGCPGEADFAPGFPEISQEDLARILEVTSVVQKAALVLARSPIVQEYRRTQRFLRACSASQDALQHAAGAYAQIVRDSRAVGNLFLSSSDQAARRLL